MFPKKKNQKSIYNKKVAQEFLGNFLLLKILYIFLFSSLFYFSSEMPAGEKDMRGWYLSHLEYSKDVDEFSVKSQFKLYPGTGGPVRPYRSGVDTRPATYDEVKHVHRKYHFMDMDGELEGILAMDATARCDEDEDELEVTALTKEFEQCGWFHKTFSDDGRIHADVGMTAEFVADMSQCLPSSYITDELLNDGVSTVAELLGLSAKPAPPLDAIEPRLVAHEDIRHEMIMNLQAVRDLQMALPKAKAKPADDDDDAIFVSDDLNGVWEVFTWSAEESA